MTTEEVRALPIGQKLMIMEAIWDDMRSQFERLDVPEKIKGLLDHRRARVRDGSAQLLQWDDVKESIGNP